MASSLQSQTSGIVTSWHHQQSTRRRSADSSSCYAIDGNKSNQLRATAVQVVGVDVTAEELTSPYVPSHGTQGLDTHLSAYVDYHHERPGSDVDSDESDTDDSDIDDDETQYILIPPDSPFYRPPTPTSVSSGFPLSHTQQTFVCEALSDIEVSPNTIASGLFPREQLWTPSECAFELDEVLLKEMGVKLLWTREAASQACREAISPSCLVDYFPNDLSQDVPIDMPAYED